MNDDNVVVPVYELLPTGKQHVSFSEWRSWSECSYRHKLQQIVKINLGKPSPHMDFGTACHAAHEEFIKTKVMDPSIALKIICEVWDKNKEFVGFEPSKLDGWLLEATSILLDVPKFYDETFPDWTPIDAEHELYEPIEKHPHAFKGFIDAVISVPNKKGKPTIWVLDAKTCGWGWDTRKKSDPMVKAQLVFYKNFWSKKAGVDPKNVRCGFVLLKRTAKAGAHCELIPVSVGDVTTTRSLKMLSNMLVSIKRGIAMKNRSSCQWCDYRGTEHCK